MRLEERKASLVNIWSSLEPQKQRFSQKSAQSSENQLYLKRVQKALDASEPLLSGLSFGELDELLKHEVLARTHVFPSHGPSFMLHPQPVSSELLRLWNRVRVWDEHSDTLSALRNLWKNVPTQIPLSDALEKSVFLLKNLPPEKAQALLAHNDFGFEHDFPVRENFNQIRSSIRGRVSQELRKSG